MKTERASRWTGMVIIVLVVLLPLAGAALANRDLERIHVFPPPLEISLEYASFSWAAAVAVMAVLGAVGAAWVVPRKRIPPRPTAIGRLKIDRRFPSWGVAAIAWTAGWWVLAWTRFEWFMEWQRYTFFPLWLGFIVTVNAATQWRVGTCLMLRAPGSWLGLFGASAMFWWAFEWLNRFVRNWHYLGVQDFGPLAYALHASLCFATVLPAVAGVAEFLESFERWRARTERGPVWSVLSRPRTGVVLVVGAGVALVLTGALPKWFYPALWLAPLALLLGESVLRRRDRGAVSEMAQGNWARAASWMVAALVCGFFWELWNWQSAAKWIYTVPGVDRWHVFEMPLLGYAGYLPFGLECLLVVERWRRADFPQDA